MEYLAGSILTLLTMVIVSRLVKKTQKEIVPVKVNFSQSRNHELIKDYIFTKQEASNTQSSKHYGKQWSKVVLSGDMAYWIEDNAVYSAKHDGAGIVIETKKIVDMMGIDKVELDKMILIVDRLTEGN
jgi:hypothetical protein